MTTKISIVVTTYNHQKYIAQCLESLARQKGDFDMEIIVGDDCSTDSTRTIAQEFQDKYPGLVALLPQHPNLGITRNLKRCLDACSSEYIAICEGDDYWTDEYKLQKQVAFLEKNLDFSMCFSALMVYFEDSNKFEPFQGQLQLTKDVLSTEDLILKNSIGNFSCCMYRAKVIRQLPDELFDLPIADWMFNMVCGQFGPIGFLRDWMSVYRKHVHGAWSGLSKLEQSAELGQLIDSYNRFFDNKYEEYFAIVKYKEVVDSSPADMHADTEPTFEADGASKEDVLRGRLYSLQTALYESSARVVQREQEIQALQEQLNSLYQSTSWKITQPLREIKSWIEKLLARPN